MRLSYKIAILASETMKNISSDDGLVPKQAWINAKMLSTEQFRVFEEQYKSFLPLKCIWKYRLQYADHPFFCLNASIYEEQWEFCNNDRWVSVKFWHWSWVTNLRNPQKCEQICWLRVDWQGMYKTKFLNVPLAVARLWQMTSDIKKRCHKSIKCNDYLKRTRIIFRAVMYMIWSDSFSLLKFLFIFLSFFKSCPIANLRRDKRERFVAVYQNSHFIHFRTNLCVKLTPSSTPFGQHLLTLNTFTKTHCIDKNVECW